MLEDVANVCSLWLVVSAKMKGSPSLLERNMKLAKEKLCSKSCAANAVLK